MPRNPMKKTIPTDPATATELEDLPNVGPAIAADLRLIGIDYPAQLAGSNGFELYDRLCSATNQKHDPCIIDVFLSAIHFMNTGEARPWWEFTPGRKAMEN